jgi:predicted transposase/invertase (TIGR01784 family)
MSGNEFLPTPHNNFFHFALSHLPSARSLIETQFDPHILRELNLETLRHETVNFVDTDLREKFSDLLFSVDLVRPQSTNSKSAYVYLLFEHKSQTDPLTAFQLLSYILRIGERRLREGLDLCPVYPLVIYHGESAWTAARSFKELLKVPSALLEYQVDFCFALLDLSQLTDEEIRGEPILRSTLGLLKYSRSVQLREKLQAILESFALAALREHLGPVQLEQWLKAIGNYIMAVNKGMDNQYYKQTLASVFPTQFEPGSLADRLLIQGREEGRQEGILAGKIQVLQELLGEPVLSDQELVSLGLSALSSLVTQLQDRLRSRDA